MEENKHDNQELQTNFTFNKNQHENGVDALNGNED